MRAAVAERIKRLVPLNHFARGVSVLAGGTVVGHAIVVLASPVLTRLYGPEDFGLLAVYGALLGISSIIASLSYQFAVPLPESDEEAIHVLVLSLGVVLIMTAVTALLVVAFTGPISTALNTPAMAEYMWLLPVGLLLVGAYHGLSYWAVRVKAFPTIARTNVAQSISKVAVQLGGYALGPFALILGQICGQAVGSVSLAALLIRERRDALGRVRWSRIRDAAWRYRRFPLFTTWSGVFNSVGRNLPPLMFASLFSPAIAGIYLLAHSVLAMPMYVIGRAVANVFFANAAGANRDGTLSTLVLNIHTKLAQLAMPAALVLLVSGQDIFRVVFGDEWSQAGVFAQLMAPYLYFQFVTSPLSDIADVLEKQVHDMMFQGLLLSTRAVALVVGALYFDVLVAVALYAAASAVCWLAFLAWILTVSENQWQEIWRITAKTALYAVLPVSPLIAFQFLSHDAYQFVAAMAATVMLLTIYTAFMLRSVRH